jgi:diguanylate cyclase (GGDEF)-like protein
MNVALALEAQDRNRALKASSIELQQKIAQIYGTKDRLRKMAYHDFVTGLPNRAKLQEMLSECAAHKSGKGALILLDLDDFRTINDVLGHDFGDRLLRAIAARLLELEQAGGRSHLLHVGGDEFVVLLPEADADVAAAELEAQRLTRHNLAALNAPFLINGHSLTISASAGIALFPDGDESQGELLQRASMALQRAKSLGRGSIQLYAAEMRREVRERLQLERDIPAGLERGEFIMHFQPQVDFAGEIVGAEALLRWRHPQHGWISPAQFVDVAEQSGLITQMGDWALQHACRQIKAWEQSLPSFSGHVSVNVSAWQFQRSDFREAVRRHLRASDIDPSRLTLEITETAFLRDLDRAVATIKSLKSDGVGFSIDDFGTGYASLSSLGRLPVDELKIDQSFIRKLGSDMRDTHLVETIINIGRCLDLRVVAEGVESDSQKSTLRALHCWALQGYYLARSMTAEAFADWLRQYQRKTSYQASHLHGKPRA